MSAPITDKAAGETISLSWDITKYAGQDVPGNTTGLFFIITIVNNTDRDQKTRIKSPDITASIANNTLTVSYSLDTDVQFFSAKTEYEADLWVIDPSRGKVRLDTWRMVLDEPETIDFSQS